MSSSRARAYTWPYPRQRNFEQQVREAAAHWFAAYGFRTQDRCPYILAHHDDWPHNIILPEVVDYIQAERQASREGFPLHKYIHHGLSSQAMVFNLIGPLIVRDDLEPLQIALAQPDISWPDGHISAN